MQKNAARLLGTALALVIVPLSGASECSVGPQDGHELKRQRDGRPAPTFNKRKKRNPKPTKSITIKPKYSKSPQITVCKKGDKRWVCPQE